MKPLSHNSRAYWLTSAGIQESFMQHHTIYIVGFITALILLLGIALINRHIGG